MYQVLLVTDQPEIRDTFESFADWTALGFKLPRIVRTAKEAMPLLDGGGIDAVAYVLPKEEGQAFFSFLAGRPQVRCLEAASDPSRLRRALNALRRGLREAEGVDALTDVLPILQAEFLHALIDGALLSREELRERAQALHLQIALDAPVCVAHLQLPQGEVYLQEVWRYGRARLEVALRNFFERDLPGVRYVLGLLSPREIRLLACPKGQVAPDEMRAALSVHLTNARESALEFLDLEVKVCGVLQYKDITALCARLDATVIE